MADEFDRWLENELGRASLLVARRPAPAIPRYRAARAGFRLASLPFSKGAIALVSALLLGGSGAMAVAAASGSPQPRVWGHYVQTAVAGCQQSLGADGVGGCVSAAARPIATASPTARTMAKPPDALAAAPPSQPAASPAPPKVVAPAAAHAGAGAVSPEAPSRTPNGEDHPPAGHGKDGRDASPAATVLPQPTVIHGESGKHANAESIDNTGKDTGGKK